MSDVMEHVAYLSQEIGPRPAGTEEEQQAALYITEKMQKDAGLSAVIEDFTGVTNNETPRAICGAVTLVFAILAVVLPVVALPAALITLLSAVIYVAEAFDKPLLSRLFSRGVSQNVIAKYEPGYSPESGSSRRRKVILVAHYDSGKAMPELNGPVLVALPILKWVVLGAFIAVPVFLLLDTTVLLHVEGVVGVILTVLTVVCAVLAALPLVQFILHKASSYNDGANCNASGVAVLMDVAERVGRGRTDMSSASDVSGPLTVHGEQAARDEGVVPEGASVSYAVETQVSHEEDSPAARLAAAKAAVAAISGKPVSDFISEEVLKASEPVVHMPDVAVKAEQHSGAGAHEGADARASSDALGIQAASEGAQDPSVHINVKVESANQPMQADTMQASSVVSASQKEEEAGQPDIPQDEPNANGLPAWFVTAQKKAKRSPEDSKPAQRSRYADALEAAVSESSVHFQEANNAVLSNAQKRMEALSDGIVEVKAPESAWLQVHPDTTATPAQPKAMQMPADSAYTQPSMNTEAQPTVAEQAAVVEFSPAEGALDPAAEAFVADIEQPASQLAAEQRVPQAKQAPSSTISPILPDDLSVPSLDAAPEPSVPSFLAEPQPAQPAQQAQSAAPAAEPVQQTPSAVERTENRIEVPAEDELDFDFDEPSQDPQATIAAAPVFVDTVTANAEQANKEAGQQPAALPSLEPLSSEELAATHEAYKQRAPLADAYDPDAPQTRKLRSALPSIDPAHPSAHRGPSAAQLRSALPSFSGILPKVEEEQKEEAPSTVSMTGSFAPVGATSAFAPVGDELLEDVDPDDIYVDDADDSEFQDPHNDAGAFAAPGYVEMPKSRMRRLFDRFHRNKKNDEETTPQEWLDVDDSFDARSVGAARGGWESFREEQDTCPDADDGFEGLSNQPGTADQPRQSAPYAEAYSNDEYDDAFDDDDFYDDYDEKPSGRRSWHGGAFSRVRMGRVDMRSGADDEPVAEGDSLLPKEPEAPEMQKIYQFRNPDIDTEVWFVALGAELGGHSGMRAFIAEHEHELKGSIIVELEGLGAGDLNMIDQEGGYRVAKTSSRMRRYTRKASQTTGLSIGSASMLWKSSASSYAITHGLQAMHLVGMEGAKPASFGSRDDVVDNLDEGTLQKRSNFVLELLKNI